MKHTMSAVAAAALITFAFPTSAAIIPSGVQNDVLYSDVVGTWGWQLVSQSNYGGGLAITDLFAGLTSTDQVMVAAKRTSSAYIDVLAAATLSDITTYTARNQTHVANNVSWYYNGYSMGFAGVGDVICQNTADTCGGGERDRLSWHTSSSGTQFIQRSEVEPLYVFNGWRSGNNLWIYEGTDWERLVFKLPGSNQVPEPASLALVGLALFGLGASRKRRSK